MFKNNTKFTIDTFNPSTPTIIKRKLKITELSARDNIFPSQPKNVTYVSIEEDGS